MFISDKRTANVLNFFTIISEKISGVNCSFSKCPESTNKILPTASKYSWYLKSAVTNACAPDEIAAFNKNPPLPPQIATFLIGFPCGTYFKIAAPNCFFTCAKSQPHAFLPVILQPCHFPLLSIHFLHCKHRMQPLHRDEQPARHLAPFSQDTQER